MLHRRNWNMLGKVGLMYIKIVIVVVVIIILVVVVRSLINIYINHLVLG